MNVTAIKWVVIGGLAVALTLSLVLRGQRTAQLRDELDLMRARHRQLAQLREENHRLAAAEPSASELESLRADHVALERLRAEIAPLRARAMASTDAKTKSATTAISPILSAAQWSNAGRATPSAAFETALWAASGGDIDTLAQSMILEADARAKAAVLLEGLPEASRAEYRSPERLVALLTAKDVPMGSMQVIGQAQQGAEKVRMVVRLQQTDGSAKTTSLMLRQDAGEWRLVVPPSVVDKYAAMLKGAPGVR